MVHRRLYTVELLRCWSCWGFARRPPPRPPSSSPATSAKDFNPVTNPNVVTTPVSTNPLNIGQSQWITANGWVSGWSIQDIRTNYDADDRHALRRHQHVQERQRSVSRPSARPTATPPARRPDTTPRTWAATSRSRWPSPRSIRRNLSQPGTPLIVAGVPADKTIAGTGTDGFTVSSYNATKAASSGLAYAVRHQPAPEHGQPGLRPELGPPAAGVHHQELQQDPRPRSRLRVLALGLRRLEPGRRRRRGLPVLVEGPGQRRTEHPRADDLAGLDARRRRGGLPLRRSGRRSRVQD